MHITSMKMLKIRTKRLFDLDLAQIGGKLAQTGYHFLHLFDFFLRKLQIVSRCLDSSVRRWSTRSAYLSQGRCAPLCLSNNVRRWKKKYL